jgi:hypothetical protein
MGPIHFPMADDFSIDEEVKFELDASQPKPILGKKSALHHLRNCSIITAKVLLGTNGNRVPMNS